MLKIYLKRSMNAIPLINYYVGVLRLEPADFEAVDHDIRQTLMKYKMHLQPGCKERLYLPRTEMGRGLHSVEMKAEGMLLQLKETLEAHKIISTRRAAILKVEEESKTHLELIDKYLNIRYKMEDPVNRESLEKAQKQSLYDEIRKKFNHEKLYRATSNPIASIIESYAWLKHGNITPRDEGAFCNLQERNIFCGVTAQCQHRKTQRKAVDHLATKCDRLLSHDYMRRHNEVVRSLHLLLCTKYGLKISKPTKNHSVQETMSNNE